MLCYKDNSFSITALCAICTSTLSLFSFIFSLVYIHIFKFCILSFCKSLFFLSFYSYLCEYYLLINRIFDYFDFMIIWIILII